MSQTASPYLPGITPRSVIASLFSMLLMGMYIQYQEVILADYSAVAELSVPAPAIGMFLMLLALGAIMFQLTKRALLTRQELLCVLFAMLLSAPMMTQGMWHRFVGLIAATPRTEGFSYIDAYHDRLWPHGENILAGAFAADRKEELITRGAVAWAETEYEKGQFAVLPVLSNATPEQQSAVAFHIPRDALVAQEPHLLSVLLRPNDLAAESSYYCRIYADDGERFVEMIDSRQPAAKTFIHQTGFLRLGSYGVKLPTSAETHWRFEVGLKGSGTLALADARLMNVSALESIFTGVRVVDQSAFEALPVDERAGLVVRPDNMWSLAGLTFLIRGYIPLEAWLMPALTWSIPIALLLLATFVINVIMRQQWADNERYPFPLAQIPMALLGGTDSADGEHRPAIWRNRWMWAGFVVVLCWGLLKGWSFYNPDVPDTNIEVNLANHITGPGWGRMWHTTFSVQAMMVAICIFFELNVLLSFVLGMLLFRSLYWVGTFTGLETHTGYPFPYEHAIGSYLGYALVVLFFSRKYLWKVLRSVHDATLDTDRADKPFSNRVALILLFATLVGAAGWAQWMGMSIFAILAFFLFLLVVGFVSTKIRAECGVPFGYFTPYNAMLFVSLLGGMASFGANGMMFCLIASGFLTVSVFFLIPGAQLELIEFGRRIRMVPRHTFYTAALGLFGGLFIGGWVFLSTSYADGGDNFKYQWAYNQNWFFSAYKSELNQVTSMMAREESGAAETGVAPSTFAYLFGGGVTVGLTVLRQLFAGFWFHPIGFVLGSSFLMQQWGSIFMAWLIRSVVLRLGGAATVKNKLLPFAVGMFLAGVVVVAFFNIYATYLVQNGIDRIYGAIP